MEKSPPPPNWCVPTHSERTTSLPADVAPFLNMSSDLFQIPCYSTSSSPAMSTFAFGFPFPWHTQSVTKFFLSTWHGHAGIEKDVRMMIQKKGGQQSCCKDATLSALPPGPLRLILTEQSCVGGNYVTCAATSFIPKLLFRLLWLFRQTAAFCRQIRTFPQLFRFCSALGNFGMPQIVRNSMLTGRWWEGRINLCDKNYVRNCDLLFFCLL